MQTQLTITLSVISLFIQVFNLNAQSFTNLKNSNFLLTQNSGYNNVDDGTVVQGLYQAPSQLKELPLGLQTVVPCRSCRLYCRDYLQLKALVPPEGRGLTNKKQPQFWLYVPSSLAETEGRFILEKINSNELIDKIEIFLPNQGGIIAIKPNISLEKNTIYRWFFIIHCDDSRSISVEGIVKRVDANSVRLQGRWYDLLSDAISSPELWKQLLRQVGLEDIADQTPLEIPLESLP